MSILLFEDRQVSRLHPITVGRPAYAISCGSFRLIDWVLQLGRATRGLVRPHLVEVQRLDYAELNASAPGDTSCVLLINARLVPSVTAFNSLQRLLQENRPAAVRTGSTIAAALLPGGGTNPPVDLSFDTLNDYLGSPELNDLPQVDVDLPLFEYPHDVVRHNLESLPVNLEHRLKTGHYEQFADGVFLAPGASIADFVVTDTKHGPIVLEENASVGPYSYLSGPIHMGRNARVIEHAAIKDAVSLAHTTKIGGEVEASIVEPYSNKQHHGFLGHSYLGRWINLGAGTCNSDLKNTYGIVNMEYGGTKVSTGMQFIGCMMGDYAKSAINTGIFTGKTLGTCSMVYGFVTTNVPSFVNYARLFGQVSELPAEVMVATQKRMFQRRQVEQRPCDIQLIHDMYENTRFERQIAGEPLSL